MTSRAIEYDQATEENIMTLAPRNVPFKDKLTGRDMQFARIDFRYNYATPGQPKIVDEFIFNGPLCHSKMGIHAPKKKEENKAPPNMIPAAQQQFMMQMMMQQMQQGNKTVTTMHTPVEDKKEESGNKIINYAPKETKTKELYKQFHGILRRAAIAGLMTHKGVSSKLASKEGDDLSRSASEYLKELFYTPMNNKIPIPGAEPNYAAKIRYDTVFQLPSPVGTVPRILTEAELTNHWIDFYPKIKVVFIYCGATGDASVQFHLVSAVVKDWGPAKEANLATDINNRIVNEDPTVVQGALNALERIKARKAAEAAEKAGTSVTERKAIAESAPQVKPTESAPLTLMAPPTTAPTISVPSVASDSKREVVAPPPISMSQPPKPITPVAGGAPQFLNPQFGFPAGMTLDMFMQQAGRTT